MASLGKIPVFSGEDYPYWKVRMRAFFQSMGAEVWDITKNQAYVVLAARVTPLQVTEHEANAKAINALFADVSREEFSRVHGFQKAHKIWTCLEKYHEGTPQVKARLFETHRREYENFTQEPGESIDLMFSRFQSIVNKVNANRSTDALEYTEHEKALKLLYALDRSVWDLKMNTIIESAGYETLTVNEPSSMVPLFPRASLL